MKEIAPSHATSLGRQIGSLSTVDDVALDNAGWSVVSRALETVYSHFGSFFTFSASAIHFEVL